MTRRGWLLFAAMGVIWGLPYLLIKDAVAHLTPATLVFARTAIGSVLLLPLAVVRGQLHRVLRAWVPLLVFTMAEIIVPWWLLSDAERHLTSSLSGLLVAAVPLAGMVIVRFLGSSEHLGRAQLLGLLLGVLGVGAVVGFDLGNASPLALGEMAVVVLCYAAGPQVLTRSLAHLPGIGVVFASLVVGAVLYAPLAAVQHPTVLPSGSVVVAVLGLGVVCTALAFVLFFELVTEVGPVRSTVITYVNPVVAVLLGVAVRHEPLSWGLLAGFLLILCGSVLATRRGRPASPPGQLLAAPPRAARSQP